MVGKLGAVGLGGLGMLSCTAFNPPPLPPIIVPLLPPPPPLTRVLHQQRLDLVQVLLRHRRIRPQQVRLDERAQPLSLAGREAAGEGGRGTGLQARLVTRADPGI